MSVKLSDTTDVTVTLTELLAELLELALPEVTFSVEFNDSVSLSVEALPTTIWRAL